VRRVSIVAVCDACQDEIEEETEGDSTVRFTARGEEWELELCGECLGGTFLQEARPVSNRKKRKKPTEEFTCYCGKMFGTQRGLTAHKTRQAHD
jgi:hypothetical protein